MPHKPTKGTVSAPEALIEEAAGSTVDFRLAADKGEYLRVGELGPNSTKEELDASFTLRDVVSKARELAAGVHRWVSVE